MLKRTKIKSFIFGAAAILIISSLSPVYGIHDSKNALESITVCVGDADTESNFGSCFVSLDLGNANPILTYINLIRNKMLYRDSSLRSTISLRQTVSVDGKDWDMIVPDDYSTIQEAVDAVGPENGYRIFIRSGVYHENVFISTDGITLHGENLEETIIDGSSNGNVLTLDSSYNNISGFSIEHSGNTAAGIYFNVSSGNQIFNCKISENNRNGLWFYHSHANNISDNIIDDNENNGVLVDHSSLANIITNNQIRNNQQCGILVNNVSRSNLIAGNEFDSNWCKNHGYFRM